MTRAVRRAPDWLLPLLGYALVTAVFFAPLGGRLVAEPIGTGDNLESLWNAWWIGRSALRFENPWFSDLLFQPYGTWLVWHSLVPLSSGAVAMLSSFLPKALAYNLVVMAALPLAGSSARALCRQMTADPVASFAGGLAFMLSPFLTSKTLGHVDLLYGALLPLFLLWLLRAVGEARTVGEARAVEGSRRSDAWWLAAVSLVILFACNPGIAVFAANLAFCLLVWQLRRDGTRVALRRFVRALTPTLVVALPWLTLAVLVSVSFEHLPRSHADPAYDPELLSYALPLTGTSLWSGVTSGLSTPRLAGVEPAVYLGVLVLPLALFGIWSRRRDPLVRHLAAVGAVFLIFSLGPKLQWQGEIVEVAGVPLYLPFGLWRWVPVLGGVGQAARYALIVYVVMSVGVACGVECAARRLRARTGSRAAANTLAAVLALLVCLDFAFVAKTTPLPEPLDLREDDPARRHILDPRLGNAETMYQQTLCGRPLVGGYISRPPPGPLAHYREDPVLGWLFRRPSGPAPRRQDLLHRLDELAIGDVLLAPDDPRGAVLASYGLRERDTNANTTVWSR